MIENINSEWEERHLASILEKLKNKIESVNVDIQDIDEQILKMDEYYWENYNEFDEYGYENHDNRQNRLMQVGSKAEQVRQRHRYEKMLDSPYFARVDFVYDGEDEAETYYIGIGNFSEKASSVPLIFDWRAPVSSLFYDFDKGPAGFEAPAGFMKGEISRKRQYKIKNGKIKYFFESEINIDDDMLKRELSMNGSDRLKSIVTTIQKEQNKIIRDKTSRILVVQGTAGSGKTSIALHRVAYLLYNNRTNMRANNVLIISPNNVFADYISHILPELNEENISEMEFDDFAARELKDAGICQDRYDQIEEMAAGKYRDSASYKQTKDFVLEINGYVLGLESDLVNFRNIKFMKLDKTAEEIQKLFYEKFAGTPILKRMETVAEYVIDEVETLTGREFDDMEVEIIKEKFINLYETTDLLKIYSNMLLDMGMECPYDSMDEKRIIRYEDVYPMLYLKYQLTGTKAHKPVKHIIIDEMQDYSYLQYAIIKIVFDCKMTILGDKHQTIGEKQINVTDYIRDVFGKDAVFMEMKKSYRQTVEIGQFAADIIGERDIEFFERHGRPPEITACRSDDDMIDKIIARIRQQFDENGGAHETAAVLCYNQPEALYVYGKIKEKLPEAVYMDKETERFKKGVTVTAFYMAKGLEFDCVHVPFWDERYTRDGFGIQAMYISATRAMHELDMYTK